MFLTVAFANFIFDIQITSKTLEAHVDEIASRNLLTKPIARLLSFLNPPHDNRGKMSERMTEADQ